jgi:hypothetical protein
VGQLQRLKKAVANSNILVLLSDMDSEQLAEAEEAAAVAVEAVAAVAGAEEAGVLSTAGSSSSTAAAGAASGSSSRGTGAGGDPEVAEMGQGVRLATIDNFQASACSLTSNL